MEAGGVRLRNRVLIGILLSALVLAVWRLTPSHPDLNMPPTSPDIMTYGDTAPRAVP